MDFKNKKDLNEKRGKVIEAFVLEDSNFCGAKGSPHDWLITQLAHGIWIDSCQRCPTANIVITERAERHKVLNLDE